MSEKTFGTRFANARKLATILEGVPGYLPVRDEESVQNYNQLLDQLESVNSEVTVTKQADFHNKVAKKELLKGSGKSLRKLLTSIGAFVRSKYGFASDDTKNISAKIKALRGGNSKKPVASGNDPTAPPDAKTPSPSHLHFGTVVFNLKDLVTALSLLVPAYTPPNKDITVENLEKMHIDLQAIAINLYKSKQDLDIAVNKRNQLFKVVKESSKSIKQTFICQFGTRSLEYTMIKSIRIS